uniref:Putative hemolymph juvenile hormone binding protein n=1 Tax=Lutzomyia longipalpis TaxID=7200 RepID=A0A7G3AKJ2_LUTLO
MRLVLLLFGLVATTLAASFGSYEVAPETHSLDDIVTRWLRGVIADFSDPNHIDFRAVDNFDFGNSLVTLNGYLRNVQVRGMSGIVVNRMNVNWQNLRFDFDITVPHLSFSGDWYDLRGRFVNILPIFGHGRFTIDLWNLNLNGHTTLSVRANGMLEMRNFHSRSRLQRFQTNFHNLLFGGEFGDLWNYIFSDMLPAIMENFHPEVTQVVEAAVLPRFNERLNAITRDDLWDIIHGQRSTDHQFIESLIESVIMAGLEVETEKPEPYEVETEKPEPYFARTSLEPYEVETEKPEPYRMETEKPEPYMMETEKPEPYMVETEKPEPYMFETEKPEPYFARTSLEPYEVETEKPEPYILETEKPEPYMMETEKPEPYMVETEKPEPYMFETEKPEPYFARTSLEPYEVETEKPEPYRMETEKPEPYMVETEKPEPYMFETEKPEPYMAETEKPEPYFARTSLEPYEVETEKPEPYFARTSLEPYEVETEKPEPYNVEPELEQFPSVIRIPLGNNAWITSITVKNIK